MRREAAFSLIELLAALLISAVLATFGFGAYRAGLSAGDQARSASNLKVLILATQLYASENNGEFPKYREDIRGQEKNGVRWWFGLEPWSSVGRGEGQREIEGESGPLGPYLGSFVQGGPCPGLAHEGRVVPKYKNSRNFGYVITRSSAPTLGNVVPESVPNLGGKSRFRNRPKLPYLAHRPRGNRAIPRPHWRNSI